MKRFLFVLLVLGWAITASAQPAVEVLVYDMKASNAGFGYVADSNTWAQIKDANTAFLIVESPAEGDTANIWAVYTWKGKDKKNYAMDVNLGQATTGAATVGSKQVGFTVDANTGNRIQVTGYNKLITIGKKTNKSCLGCHTADELKTLGDLDANCPPSLTGYEIKIKTDADGNKKLCTSTLSLKLDIAKTLATHGNVDTAEDEASAIISDLRDAGYIIVEP